ncbi:DNA end-binding protein Ku [Paraburkholderia steynii]|uniref:Non-homologous end joining protein Ku n=1 Tax=Paraburkholderia steynii TaxID=1245441 RepID=A0A7Z7FM13_9BURK|nr:Ku protein [Paraburkholderia steynii]SDI92338.1 DNA end-binding protein Ku [Paraburkholderia steynii]
MAARSIASLSLSFGLVSIPVKLYAATESSSDVRFNLLAPDGSRVKQQYVSEKTGAVVERSSMNKGYEFERDRFVVFTGDELKALEDSASHVVEIVAFIPEKAVNPVFYDKAYYIAPDKRGGKPYSLLQQALAESGRCALAKWAFRGRTRIVQVRPEEGGLVFQQLLYADEVRSLSDLHIEHVQVSDSELKLALQIIEQGTEDNYDPTAYVDEEKQRILAAIDEKIEGKQIIANEPAGVTGSGGQVIDLMDALRASLKGGKPKAAAAATPTAPKRKSAEPVTKLPVAPRTRKPATRAEKAPAETPAKVRARK